MALKEYLKLKGITYGVLAKRVGVSLPTIKRWMTGDDFSVAALESILAEIGITLSEFSSRIQNSGVKRNSISEKQEDFLVSNPRAALVYFLIFHEFSEAEIVAKLGITKSEFEKSLFQLDKVDLISMQSSKSYKILVRGPFAWSEHGKFSKFFFPIAAQIVYEKFLVSHQGFSKGLQSERALARLTEMYLSEKSFTRLKIDIWEVMDRYREISRQETLSSNRSELSAISTLLFVDRFPMWERVLNRPFLKPR